MFFIGNLNKESEKIVPNLQNRSKIKTMEEWKLFLEQQKSQEGWHEICQAILGDTNNFDIHQYIQDLEKPEEVISDENKIFEVYLYTIGTWFNNEGQAFAGNTKYMRSEFFTSRIDANKNEARLKQLEKCFELFVQNTSLLETNKNILNDGYSSSTFFLVFQIQAERNNRKCYQSLFKIANKEDNYATELSQWETKEQKLLAELAEVQEKIRDLRVCQDLNQVSVLDSPLLSEEENSNEQDEPENLSSEGNEEVFI